ncbi:hypothetical protein J1614_004003 [Plenodomus biglobosus]|nr:hypothetical protein J1614_004003 [Plenodomus biglobosus]
MLQSSPASGPPDVDHHDGGGWQVERFNTVRKMSRNPASPGKGTFSPAIGRLPRNVAVRSLAFALEPVVMGIKHTAYEPTGSDARVIDDTAVVTFGLVDGLERKAKWHSLIKSDLG